MKSTCLDLENRNKLVVHQRLFEVLVEYEISSPPLDLDHPMHDQKGFGVHHNGSATRRQMTIVIEGGRVWLEGVKCS